MTKRAVFLILLAVLCSSAALAAPKNQNVFTLTGQFAAGGFNTTIPLSDGGTGRVNLYFSPQPLADGTWGYYVDILWNDGSTHEIYGLVSAGVVKSKGPWGPVQLNITHSVFIDPQGIDQDKFASLVGTLTAYKGPGSSYTIMTGRRSMVSTGLDGTTQYSQSFKGTMASQSATFEGTFGTTSGSFLISEEGPNPNPYITVYVGNMNVTLY